VRALLLGVVLQLAGQQFPPSGTSADTALERRTREVASELRCPVCQGLSIADSPSELAVEMKSVVRDQLASGRTPDDVKRYFIDKYGEWILLAPKPTGANLLVYLLPAALVLGGLAVIGRAVRRWSAVVPPSVKSGDGPAGPPGRA
jgi:cytochrome c-type biogenesis protein CcmH